MTGFSAMARVWPQCRDLTFSENVLFDHPITILIRGGFASGFGSNSGLTSIQGSMTIGDGEATIENTAIK